MVSRESKGTSSHGRGRTGAEASGGQEEEEAAAAFWGPFSSLSCRTFPRCAYAPTYTTYPPYYLTRARVCVYAYARGYTSDGERRTCVRYARVY